MSPGFYGTAANMTTLQIPNAMRRWSLCCQPGRASCQIRRGFKSASESRFFKVSEEVRQGLHERRPVVALETAIYTHGFPYPDNLSLASHLESLVRLNGGIPATVGLLNGVARVGLSSDELEQIVSSPRCGGPTKVSRRDLGFVSGLKTPNGNLKNGGTTIAGTMVLAHMAGIKIFATGGLGGVHRGTEMDVSADLTELGRTPVAVISSGVKSFLDIAKTLEVLETQGVPVATFRDGRPGPVDYPGFYTRESGIPSPMALDNVLDAAQILHAHFSLGLQSGVHFANPVPEEHSLAKEVMDAAIVEALERAKLAGVAGAAATPFILSRIKEIIGDESIASNRALIASNVVKATSVARELRALEEEDLETSMYEL